MISQLAIEQHVIKPLASHSCPVNLQAAKIFWKAPWWAKLPPDDKEKLIHTSTKLEDLVDVFQAPPKKPGGPHNQIYDLRGKKVKNKKGGTVALVLGYAHAKRRGTGKARNIRELYWSGHGWIFSQCKGNTLYENEHRWYAFYEGCVQIINGRKWALAGNYELITP